MMDMTEEHDAWWPPTFSPSRLGRIWLALWIIHDDSHSSLRSSCLRMWRWSVVARDGSVAVVSIIHSRSAHETTNIGQFYPGIHSLQRDLETDRFKAQYIFWIRQDFQWPTLVRLPVVLCSHLVLI